MEIREIACRKDNYGGPRQGPVRYLVLHYTAGHNDTAQNNGIYFARERVGASAHYFVDETEIVRSVPDNWVAWHCGGRRYLHPHCRNGNAIGIEMCSKWADGRYFLAPETVQNAQALTRALMAKYGIDRDHVIRHYDVTHKKCPAPMVGAGEGLWEDFLEGLMRYETMEQLPDWSRKTIGSLVDRGILQGSGQGLDLSRDMVRLLVILDRAGIFQKEERET